MEWREITVNADKMAVEAVSELMVQCGTGGVVIEDPEIIREMIAANVWDAFQFPEELLARDFVRVKAYLPCDSGIDNRLADLHTGLEQLNSDIMPGSIKDVGLADIKEEDWANSWKAYYKPVRVGEKIVIKPTWETYEARPGDIIIELDPGMAFGTGTHASTVMCLEFLEKVIRGGESVFDIGTGSGILAIAAARLGAARVTAVDMDEVAVVAAKDNVTVNQAGETVEVSIGDLLTGVKGQADIVVANIVANVIIRLSSDAYKAVKPGGFFIASGIIVSRTTDVIAAIEGAGFKVREAPVRGEWVSMLAVREE